MRTKKVLLNSITSLLLQFVTMICGFILPKLILMRFGSEVNGAISSISQFLGYISMLEAGVGGVTRAALYKPLAENDVNKICGILKATQSFFRKIALIFVCYSLIVGICFKSISNSSLEWSFLFSLVLIISISTFIQYYFGITYTILLQANQSNYISNLLNILTVIINTIFSLFLLSQNVSIHIVKLVAASVYIIKPIILYLYVNKYYKFDSGIEADYDSIKQRWNGLGHHIAFFIQNNTDIMIITLLLGLKSVSIYSVYALIVFGIKRVVNSLSGGSEAALGNMIAKNETKALNTNFTLIEIVVSVLVVTFFSVTGILLSDFIGIYTKNIIDINYVIEPIGMLFVLSEAINCIKQPYYNLVVAAGYYKETQGGAFCEAFLNIGLSFLFAKTFGIAGVLLGTIISSLYRTLDLVLFLRNTLLKRSVYVFLRRQSINILIISLILLVYKLLPFTESYDYFLWFLKGVQVFGIACSLTLLCNYVFYKKQIKLLVHKLKNGLRG